MIKKVGILTFHNSINFGAALQCTALYETISGLGYDVKIVNYIPNYAKKGWNAFQNPFQYVKNEPTVKKKIRKIFKNTKSNVRYFEKRKKIIAFQEYWIEHLIMTEECSSLDQVNRVIKEFDALVCGSDQIWNPACTGGELDSVYFLNVDSETCKKIAYAPSLGGHKQKDYFDDCRPWVQSLDCVSVREISSKRQFEENGINNVSAVLDPTLLLTKERWEEILTPKKMEKNNYILVYTLDYCPDLVSVLHEILKEKPMEVIDISSNSPHLKCKNKKQRSLSPADFYSYIYNAEIVLTNSFHATVFSVLQEKKFVTFSRPGMESRTQDFLRLCDMESHLYNAEKHSYGLNVKFDFSISKENIAFSRKESMIFLENALNGNESDV